jgi:Peptidase family M28
MKRKTSVRLRHGLLLAIVLTISGVAYKAAQEGPARNKPSTAPAAAAARADRLNPMNAPEDLFWPLPASAKQYGSIDGRHIKTYVEELAAIARKSRDTGHQFWGRIAGMDSADETQNWIESKLRKAGLEVRLDEFVLSPQKIPRSWEVNVKGSDGKTLKLTSAYPSPLGCCNNFTPVTPDSGAELEIKWVGLGMASDFLKAGDVRGKAVFIFAYEVQGGFSQSTIFFGTARRAIEAGAAALVVVMPLPGNMSQVLPMVGVGTPAGSKPIPMFSIGNKDGLAVETLVASSMAAGSKPPTVQMRLTVDTVTNRKLANVVGMLPGQTDEYEIVTTHSDGFFEGANDNAAGTASLVALAEYFAKIPKQQRRRTMYFIGTQSHHGGSQGDTLIHDSMKDILAKTAVIINPEHVSVMQPYDHRGTNREEKFYRSNTLGASLFGVYGSDRLARLIIDDFALFGVPTELDPFNVPGTLGHYQYDAPSLFLQNKGTYYHLSADSTDIVPAAGLEGATRALAKILDDVNQVDLKDLRSKEAPPPARR